jgi:hypothetical protein
MFNIIPHIYTRTYVEHIYMFVDLYADEAIKPETFAGLNKSAMKLEMLMARNTIFKVARAKSSRLKPPGRFLQAQKLDVGHVKSIKSGIQSTASTPEHGIGICINTALYKKWKAGGNVTLEDLLAAGIEMHAGNHTRVAITSLNAAFPDNPLFWFQQFICHLLPATEEVFEAIRTAGALANVKARNTKGSRWFDTTYTMHINLEGLKAKHAPRQPPAAALKRLKNSWCQGHSLTAGTMSTYYLLANLSGTFWEKFWTVISGEGIPDSSKKKFKKWTSSNTFNQMSLSDEMIPHDILQNWLDEGIMGDISSAQFRKRCLMYKCSSRLKKKIVEHLYTCYLQAGPEGSEATKCPLMNGGTDEQDWKYVAKRYPRLATTAFLNTYVKICWDQPVKSGFPETLYDDCAAAFKKAHSKDNDEKIEVYKVVHPLIYFHVSPFVFNLGDIHASQQQKGDLDQWGCPSTCSFRSSKEL